MAPGGHKAAASVILQMVRNFTSVLLSALTIRGWGLLLCLLVGCVNSPASSQQGEEETKPESVIPISFGAQRDADGQLSVPNAVFEPAELCYGLAHEGCTGQQIVEELG